MFKFGILAILYLAISTSLSGQSSCDSNAIFIVSEEPPIPNITYDQIETKLNDGLIIDNYHLPTDNLIRIRFIINCNGESLKYKMLSPIDSILFEWIIQRLKSEVNWTPARQAHRNVDSWITLTISSKNGRLTLVKDQTINNKRNKYHI
jgi:hypothetical protein